MPDTTTIGIGDLAGLLGPGGRLLTDSGGELFGYVPNSTLVTNGVTVGTSAVRIDTGLSGRRAILIVNNGSATIYVGASDVTASTGAGAGIPVAPGGALQADLGPAIAVYAVAASGSQDVRVWEAS